MAWKETERSKAVLIRRTYRCTDCKYEFRWVHTDEAEDAPECPMCAMCATAPAAAGEAPPTPKVDLIPPLPAIGTVKGRAIDYTQAMVEQQFGMTDMNDNQRVGDIAFKGPAPMQTAEREAFTRELMAVGVPLETTQQMADATSNFWQGGMMQPNTEATLGNSSVSAVAAKAARDAGADPTSMLEAGRERGMMTPKYDVFARAGADG